MRLEAVGNEVVDQIAEQIEVSARCGRERAGEIHVMVRVAQPEERRPDHAIAERAASQANDFPQQHAVGENGHMPPVLLEGRDRNDDRQVTAQLLPPSASSTPVVARQVPSCE